jgi:hypothetical protein
MNESAGLDRRMIKSWTGHVNFAPRFSLLSRLGSIWVGRRPPLQTAGLVHYVDQPVVTLRQELVRTQQTGLAEPSRHQFPLVLRDSGARPATLCHDDAIPSGKLLVPTPSAVQFQSECCRSDASITTHKKTDNLSHPAIQSI